MGIKAKKLMTRVTLWVAGALALASCGPEIAGTIGSDLSIRSGIHLSQGDKNTAPGLVAIGGCSATLVSTNTLITAAHCTSRGARVCIRSGDYNGTCSNNTYLPREYRGEGTYGFDVAVVVFDGNPFKNYYKVSTSPISRGDRVVMVGYSEQFNNEPGKGSKRWGLNEIQRLNPREIDSIRTTYGSSADKVAVDPGDSGGTMLNSRCELIGVTSRKCGDGSCSLHTNIVTERNQNWLKTMMQTNGAKICGLPGTPASSCAASGMAYRASNPEKEADGTPGFPCAPGGNVGNQSIPDDGNLKVALAQATNGVFKMFVSAPGANVTVSACANVADATQCTTPNNTNAFGGKLVRAAGSRGVYEIQKIFTSQDVSPTWTFVSRDASGQILKARSIRISQ